MTKERRDWCKQNSICTRCGKNKAREGKTTCESCAKKKNRREEEDREWFKEHNICVQCRKNRASPNRVRCDDCLEKASEYKQLHKQDNSKARETAKNLREKYLSVKLCSKCGKKPTCNGTKYCVECLLKSRRNNRKYKEERRDTKTGCLWCGKEKYKDKQYCLNCYKKLVEHLNDIRPMANKDQLKGEISLIFMAREAKKNGFEKHREIGTVCK